MTEQDTRPDSWLTGRVIPMPQRGRRCCTTCPSWHWQAARQPCVVLFNGRCAIQLQPKADSYSLKQAKSPHVTWAFRQVHACWR
jgi:hypothetical protein